MVMSDIIAEENDPLGFTCTALGSAPPGCEQVLSTAGHKCLAELAGTCNTL